MLCILPDRGIEYKGKVANHAYELLLSVAGIPYTTTQWYAPQSNGMCERFNKPMKEEFFATAMRKKIYTSLDELQSALDVWLWYYNSERPHRGKYCYGQTLLQTFMDSKGVALEKHNELMFYKETSDSCQLTDKIIV